MDEYTAVTWRPLEYYPGVQHPCTMSLALAVPLSPNSFKPNNIAYPSFAFGLPAITITATCHSSSVVWQTFKCDHRSSLPGGSAITMLRYTIFATDPGSWQMSTWLSYDCCPVACAVVHVHHDSPHFLAPRTMQSLSSADHIVDLVSVHLTLLPIETSLCCPSLASIITCSKFWSDRAELDPTEPVCSHSHS